MRIDSRDSLLRGGDSGPAIVSGQPGASRLVEAIEYGNIDLRMPPKGKLPDAAIADVRTWIQNGASWPAEVTAKTVAPKFDLAARKATHWAWKPIRPPGLPEVGDGRWIFNDVDRFVLAGLRVANLRPATDAAPHALLRRIYFDLVGLPPPADVATAFAADPSRLATEKIVDRLLASPQFGERWARHWLDLVRYAETRGNEFDYPAPNAWQYRDYLIRAFNADVPYDRFVMEHVAGDLMPDPRRHPSAGFNESILATGVWSLGEQVHSPVDLKQDEADHVDGMIDVLTKAFLGLTVSCARCHDHKFDAIATKDYYALAGVFKSAGIRQLRFETADREREVAARLRRVESEHATAIRQVLAASLHDKVGKLPNGLEVQLPPGVPPSARVILDFASSPASDWRPDGVAFGSGPRKAGELLLHGSALRINTVPAAIVDPAFLELKSTGQPDPGDLGKAIRAGRTIRTPETILTGGRVFYLVQGPGLAYAAVQAHQMMEGPLHRQLVKSIDGGSTFRWVEHDLRRYSGHRAHIEFTATGQGFAVAAVIESSEAPAAISRSTLNAAELGKAVERFAANSCRAQDAAAVAALLEGSSSSPTELAQFQSARSTVLRDLPGSSMLAPALLDGSGINESVFIRGNPNIQGESVPRRFLEALGGAAAFDGPGSGRLELARQMTDVARNPFIARVIVNRIWHHLFGRGIVASVDNFGALGETPTHPDLLDWLADDFVRHGWSIKRLIRQLVLSRTYAMASQAEPSADAADPENRWWHRAMVRRLDSESIRDSMLAVAGTLHSEMYGPPQAIHLTAFMEGRGRPSRSGLLDGGGRRSLYLEVRRNFLDPMQAVFDQPAPAAPFGRRTVSNVPAQALTLLNDPFVHQQSAAWSRRIREAVPESAERVHRMYRDAFARAPSSAEVAACLAFIDKSGRDATAWADLAHSLWNVKEFIILP